jgi:hypothetical protein
MKALLLSAVLLLPVAFAQGTAPAASAPVLTLSAAVGESVELLTTMTSRTTLSNVQVTALPDSDRTADELAEIRKDVMAGMGNGTNTTANGNLSYRVTDRTADGSATLVTTTAQSEPGEPPISLKITQTLARDGRVSGLKFESDNEILRAALASYTADTLRRLADQGGYSFSGVYGQPLTPGQSYSQSHKLDVSALLSGLFSAFASQAELPDLFGQVQSSPLSFITATTYGGLDARGLHSFIQNSTFNSWSFRVGGSGKMPTIAVDLAQGRVSGTQTYRSDGLPGPSIQKIHLVLNLAMEMEGVQLKATMTADQTVTAKPR